MSRKTMLAAAVSAAAIGFVTLLAQSRTAEAAVRPAEPVTTVAEPATPHKRISRRERMARIVAEQAAITAEASARRTLARRAAERDTATR